MCDFGDLYALNFEGHVRHVRLVLEQRMTCHFLSKYAMRQAPRRVFALASAVVGGFLFCFVFLFHFYATPMMVFWAARDLEG